MKKLRHSKTRITCPRAHLFGKVAQLMPAMNPKNWDIGLTQSDAWFLFAPSRFLEVSPIAEHIFLIQNTERAEYCGLVTAYIRVFLYCTALLFFSINIITLLQKTIIDYILDFLTCLSSEGRVSSKVINTGRHPNDFTSELIETFRNEIVSVLHKLFKRIEKEYFLTDQNNLSF